MERLKQVLKSWVTKSLAVGAAAVALDLVIGTGLIVFFEASPRVAAMSGTVVGGIFTFFANRHFAFSDTGSSMPQSAWRYGLTTLMLSLAHGQVVVMLQAHQVPFVPAKVAADLLVITFTQLVLLRFFVFPRRAQE
jgi:putative flippase GtrA